MNSATSVDLNVAKQTLDPKAVQVSPVLQRALDEAIKCSAEDDFVPKSMFASSFYQRN
jgi:hypothetical protein